MGITVSKGKVVRKMLVTARNQINTDQVKLPANALRMTGIQVTESHLLIAPDGAVDRYYFGPVSGTRPVPTDITALSTGVLVANTVTVTGSAGQGQYFYYAHPIFLYDPTFHYNGLEGGFLNLGLVTLTTPEGTLPFKLWRSLNQNLGSVTLIINH